MRDSFPSVVAALWRSLDLTPAPTAEVARLRVDGRTVWLRAAPDGAQVLVAAGLGRLAADQAVRGAQLRRLMRDGLGTVVGNQAALCLKPDGEVEAVATAPCRLAALPLLRATIEDVLQLLEIHGATLSGGSTGDEGRSSPLPAWSPAESLIFRL